MGSNPIDIFLWRRISEANERRPSPPARPQPNPVTGPSAVAPGNPVPPSPKAR